jgi:aryl-alcohol dehydrogenase-like predicted oxidoreductase
MEKMRLGRTNLTPCRTGFGALPIQRLTVPEAVGLLHKAYEGGINFYDTARGYSDSEEKLGIAFEGVRKNVFIATKTHAHTRDQVLRDLETSLAKLKTDYIDIGQMHNPSEVPDPEDKDSAYAAFREMREQGVVRFIGMSQHKLHTAREAVRSGLFDTIQYPLSALSTEEEQKFILECKEADIGVIAMKALSGGLITNAATSFAFLRQFDNVIPIWGVQRETELTQLLSFEENPPLLDGAMWETILKDREQLSGAFCRACGYCSP